MIQIPEHPLKRIGMSLSGGGYRAATFHLGAMSYLNRLMYEGKPLLENVRIISTVSGGSITGIIYALQKQNGESFQSIYEFILQKLYTVDLVKEGIDKLNPDGEWSNHLKTKNLINAFAELYDKEFTESKTFAEFSSMTCHLEAVVFNSTEFDNGINFRFRDANSGYFGNKKIQIEKELAAEVKLADAMASSSCFTGGFEPMVWPDDFCYEGAKRLLAEKNSGQQLGLMDGGIYDNQGIESILNYKPTETVPYLDLVIVSDVGSPYMKGYRPTKDQAKEGIRKLTIKDLRQKLKIINRNINAGLLIISLLFALAPLFNGYKLNWFTGFCIGFSLASIIVFIIKVIAVGKLSKAFKNLTTPIVQKIPFFFREKLSKLKIEELSIRRLEPLLIDRINSLGTLVGDVFLKIVRRLNYYKLYDNPKYKYRRVSNLIRELTQEDFENRRKRINEDAPTSTTYLKNSVLKASYEEVVGMQIKEVAEKAASFGTTLWFKDKEELDSLLDKLVASGQFTMCYNMLKYLEILIFEEGNGFKGLDSALQKDIMKVHEQCKKDWLLFVQNPLFLYNQITKINK